MPVIQSKMPHTGTSIFTVMSVLAAEHNAINLGQGFPDFPMDEQLTALVNEAIQYGFNQYAHMFGHGPLREAIAHKVAKLYGTSIHPDKNITVTPGGTYAIYSAITAVINPGDEVIVFEPVYDSYIPNIEINGGIAVKIKLRYPDYHIDWKEVSSRITPRTKMIIINSPHNPTGSVLSGADIQELRRMLEGTGVFILSDEVYEHLVFGGRQHQSMLRYPDLLERSFVCFSLGKVYHCTGWKLGYCIAPEAFTNEFRKVHQFNCFSCNMPMQAGLAAFMQNEEAYLQLGDKMQQKQQYLQEMMSRTPLKPLPTFGSYFQLYSYEGISDKGELDFAKELVADYGVATIPVSAFYSDGTENKVLRFCFAKKEETLENAAERLMQLNTR